MISTFDLAACIYLERTSQERKKWTKCLTLVRLYYMSYESTITSKGTITIPSTIRNSLGLKPGRKVRFSINKHNKMVVDPGVTVEEFEALRASIVKKIPPHLKGLTVRELKEKMSEAWVASESNKS